MTAIFLIVIAILVGAIGLNIYVEDLLLKKDVKDYEEENIKKYELDYKNLQWKYTEEDKIYLFCYLSIDENIERFKLKTPTKFL